MFHMMKTLYSNVLLKMKFIYYIYEYHSKMYKYIKHTKKITVIENYHGFKEYYPKLLNRSGLLLVPISHKKVYMNFNQNDIIYYNNKYIVLHGIINKILIPRCIEVMISQSEYSNALIQVAALNKSNIVLYLTKLYGFPAIKMTKVVSKKTRLLEYITGLKLLEIRFLKFRSWSIMAEFKFHDVISPPFSSSIYVDRDKHIFQDDNFEDLDINLTETAARIKERFHDKSIIVKPRPGSTPSKLATLLAYPVIDGDLPLELYVRSDNTILCLNGSCQAWHKKVINIYDCFSFEGDEASTLVMADTIAELIVYDRYDTLACTDFGAALVKKEGHYCK